MLIFLLVYIFTGIVLTVHFALHNEDFQNGDPISIGIATLVSILAWPFVIAIPYLDGYIIGFKECLKMAKEQRQKQNDMDFHDEE